LLVCFADSELDSGRGDGNDSDTEVELAPLKSSPSMATGRQQYRFSSRPEAMRFKLPKMFMQSWLN